MSTLISLDELLKLPSEYFSNIISDDNGGIDIHDTNYNQDSDFLSSESSISMSLNLNYSHLPTVFIGIFNSGDYDILCRFIKSVFHPYCKLVLYSPGNSSKKFKSIICQTIGNRYIVDIFIANLKVSPDAIYNLKSCYFKQIDNITVVKLKTYFTCTVMFPEHWESFNPTLQDEFLSVYFQSSEEKLFCKVLQKMHSLEDRKFMQLKFKQISHIYFDSSTNAVIKFENFSVVKYAHLFDANGKYSSSDCFRSIC